jgi:hypothetical protein
VSFWESNNEKTARQPLQQKDLSFIMMELSVASPQCEQANKTDDVLVLDLSIVILRECKVKDPISFNLLVLKQ